jgi:hypothetical protein
MPNISINQSFVELLTAVPQGTTVAHLVAQMAERMVEVRNLFLKEGRRTTNPQYRAEYNIGLKTLELGFNPDALVAAAAALPMMKRHSYDRAFDQLVETTRPMPTDEVIGQLANVSLPFDKFWLEGPVASSKRIGFLIEADQATKGFSFQSFGEVDSMNGRMLGFGKRALMTDGMKITVSPTDGIKFDEDGLVNGLEALQKLQVDMQKMRSTKGMGQYDFGEASEKIDHVYAMADGIARALMVLGSDRIPNNFQPAKTKEDLMLEDKNRRRMAMKRLPILPVSEIKIDVSKVNPKFFKTDSAADVRLLLGWTSVRRSKEIISKYGKKYTRKPHDRKIAADVDRRDAVREITSSVPGVVVEVVAGRPTQVRKEMPGNQQEM